MVPHTSAYMVLRCVLMTNPQSQSSAHLLSQLPSLTMCHSNITLFSEHAFRDVKRVLLCIRRQHNFVLGFAMKSLSLPGSSSGLGSL